MLIIERDGVKSEYTGSYNCTARYKSGRIESVSWYIYFYPNDGQLFLNCPSTTFHNDANKCSQMYWPTIKVSVPCKALHPNITVVDSTKWSINNSTPALFSYEPEKGFVGVINVLDQNEFLCKATYANFTQVQRFRLNRKPFKRVEIVKNKNILLLEAIDGTAATMVLERDQLVNFTCKAKMSCITDFGYDFNFLTNTTDIYRIDYRPNYEECVKERAQNSNSPQYEFKKSLIIEKAKASSAFIQCQLVFGGGEFHLNKSQTFFYITTRN